MLSNFKKIIKTLDDAGLLAPSQLPYVVIAVCVLVTAAIAVPAIYLAILLVAKI